MPALLVLASGNPNKLAEMNESLASFGIHVLPVPAMADLPAISETGTTLAENAAIKATTIAHHIQAWTLGDDTGLFVPAQKDAPGIRSARFAGPQATAAENRQKLLSELSGVPDELRAAYFECCLVVADPAGQVRLTLTARCHGVILTEPRGNSGFGYDSLFLIREYRRTFAELSPVAKSVLSHRGRAAQRLGPQVVRLLGTQTSC